MSNSINAISSSSISNSGSSSSTALSEETKAKLQALGIDTKDIKTEAKGQEELKEAKEKQSAQKAAPAKKDNSEKTMKTEAQDLASQVNVPVGNNDTMDTILSNISTKLDELKSSAGTDPTKLADVDNYQKQFASISSEYSQMQVSKAMISNSLQGLAAYNKAALGLAA